MTRVPRSRRLSGATAGRAREFVGSGRQPVVARPAATVVVIRDAPEPGGSIEVYVHHRHRGMRFAAGVVAFPGGGADPVDAATALDDEDGWMRRLGVDDPAAARTHVAAAVRELAEETGLAVAPSDLLPWAHWITPTFQDTRFDTWFFLLALPAGATLSDVSGETEGVAWVRPADELARADAGESVVMPPTRSVLTELAGFGSVDEALAAADGRKVVTVLPSWELDGDDVVLTTDGGAW